MISQQNFVLDCQKALYCQLGLPIHEESGTIYSQTGVPHPFLNGVLRCNTTDAKIEAVINTVKAHFKQRGLPYSWWVAANEAPSSLRQLLEREGLNYLGNFSVMVVDLTTAQAKMLLENVAKADNKVQIVKDDATLAMWGNAIGRSFQVTQLAMEIYLDLMKKASNEGLFTNVLALKDGKGVATGSITCTKEGAYICNDCTLDEERNFGFGKNVTAKLLEIALQKGCQRVAVISAPSELEDYKSLGFVEQGVYHIYC